MTTTTVPYEDILDYNLGGYYWGAKPNPEHLIAEHLDFVADVDLAEPDYSFDLLRIYVRKSDGMLLWATDSGCSCPSPFEDVRVKDLRESTLATLADAYFAQAGGRHDHDAGRSYYAHPEARVRTSIREALKVAKERGAR